MDDYRMSINGNNGDMGMEDFAELTDPFLPENMVNGQMGSWSEENPMMFNSMVSGNNVSEQERSRRSTPATPSNGSAELPTPSIPSNGQMSNGTAGNRPATPGNGSADFPMPSVPSSGSTSNRPASPGGMGELPTPSVPNGSTSNRPATPGGTVELPTPSLPGSGSAGNRPATPGGPAELPTPSLPDGSEIPAVPLPPIVGQPDLPTPSLPGNNQGFTRVRALNAVANYGELALSVGDVVIGSAIPYGTSTQYSNVPDGFRVVTISTAGFPRRIIFRQVLPFVANTSITLAMVNTSNGIGIQMVSDLRCVNMNRQLSCLRMVNLSYNSDPMDLALEDGRVIFSDVRFREITPFKRARPGRYNFVLLNSPSRPIPIVSDIVLINDLTYRLNGNWNALLQFSIDMKANTMYTVYIIGNDGYVPGLQPYIMEN